MGDTGDTARAEAAGLQQPRDEKEVRHYPLDMPDLPFARYEHRRLTARDIMVHRIMTDFMNPRRVSRQTYRQPPPEKFVPWCEWTFPRQRIFEQHVFDAFMSQDRDLGRDMRTLAKMLLSRPHYLSPQPHENQAPSVQECPGPPHPGSTCLGDWVLDLVERHYLECECARLRAWFAHLRPPQLPPQQPHMPRGSRAEGRNRNRGGLGGQNSGAFINATNDTTTTTTANTNRQRKTPRDSHIRASRTKQLEHQRFVDADAKKLRPDEVLHLRSLQQYTAVQDRLPLYDGGGFMTELRRETASRPTLASDQRHQDLWQADHARMLENFGVMQPPRVMFFALPSDWPGLQRHMLWACRLGQYGATPIRGRKTEVARRTGIEPNSPNDFVPVWEYGTRRAHYVPRRRRSQTRLKRGQGQTTHYRVGSEPPPGTFSSARLNLNEKLDLPFVNTENATYHARRLILVYPRMNLAQLDRRSRRRSLSRTRIEEMFEWDVDMADPPEATSSAEPATATDNTATTTPEQGPAAQISSPRHHHSILGHPHVRRTEPRCENCFDPAHTTAECRSPCGHCGAPSRAAPGEGWDPEGRWDPETDSEEEPRDPKDAPRYRRRDRVVWAAVRQQFGGPSPSGVFEYVEPRSHFSQHGYGPEPDWVAFFGGRVPGPPPRLRTSFALREELLPNMPATQAALHQKPHKAPQCPLPKTSRCKCMPFPTFHPALKCPVPCRRDCSGGGGHVGGQQQQQQQQQQQSTDRPESSHSASIFGNNDAPATSNDSVGGSPAGPSSSRDPPHRPGSFQHRNAMTCRARCCMCGLPGHSGRECRLRRCRCGAQHLGQDCTWRPACPAPGCPRYLCGLHCRECGRAARPMVGGRCRACLGSPEAKADEDGEGHELAAPPSAPDGENATVDATTATAASPPPKRDGTADGEGPAQAKDTGKEVARGRKRRNNKRRGAAQEAKTDPAGQIFANVTRR